MPVMNRRAARTAARGAVLPAVAALLWTSATPAAAHTELTGATPAEGSSVASLPERVRLSFSDPMSRKYAKVSLTGPRGAALAGEPEVDGEDVSVRPSPSSPPGRYRIGYRVVSADGHPVSGVLSFTVTGTPVTETPVPKTSVAETPVAGTPVPKTSVPGTPAPETPGPEATAPAGGSSGRDTLVGAVGAVAVVGSGWAWMRLARRRRARRAH
ncbi:copper resistance protein CopC [Streptomyces sp. NPDC059255]|uniref:copper resistance CopC family protein n=1 Tax=Streptomyces sp. NPDC059255 TaxID=3346793 RepID=UPI00368B9353